MNKPVFDYTELLEEAKDRIEEIYMIKERNYENECTHR